MNEPNIQISIPLQALDDLVATSNQVAGLLYLLGNTILKSDERITNPPSEIEADGIAWLASFMGHSLHAITDAIESAHYKGNEASAETSSSAPASENLPESRISGDTPDLAPIRPKPAAIKNRPLHGVARGIAAGAPESQPSKFDA